MDEMILRESSEEQTLEYAEDIRKAGNTLLGLINDILDFSKIEAGKTQIITAEYQLSSMLNDIVNMIEPRAVEKKLRFVPEIDPGTPDRLFGDEMRIKQIIMNLLTNAVKYTSSGSVTLSISHERADEYVRLRVSVRDTGSGIKKEDVEKLFIAFERIDEARNRSIEGTGLGLTITQQLLTLMDSRLEIESVYGEGSDFRFSLKQKIAGDDPVGDYGKALERSRAARKTYRESFTAPDANVLVVDDTDMNLVVFTKLLKKTRMRIDTATSGDEAISLAERNRYDIIFLDHRMPEKDGIETLHEIMSDEKGLNRATPAVCLTANAISGMREKYLAEGFREYITKPIDPMRLEAMIIALLPDGLVRPAENDDDYMPAAESAEDELMGLFLDSLPRSYAQIERFCADGDIKNYTIKVHALKSTARLVGESELSALAEKLENAGEKGDIGFIRDNTEKLLGMYRGVAERYGRSFDEPAVSEELPEATEDMMEEAYRNMKTAAVNFDYDELFEVLSVLGGFRVPEAHRQRIRDLTAAAENVDWGELKRLLS
ncbi:MAG: response regulator [Ruminiclostridium sp.]|nr:response regulator [Ruminiclostridium sp.]